MKKILTLLILTMLMVACGDVPQGANSEPIGEETQEASFLYSKTNGILAMSNGPTRFCHLTYVGAVGGHAGGGTWPNGFAKIGAKWSAEGNSLVAQPSQGLGMNSTATARATCDDFSTYGFGPQASQSGLNEYYRLWPESGGQGFVSDTAALWNAPASFCFINGADSITTSPPGNNEAEQIAVYPNWPMNRWELRVMGYRRLGGYAKCVYPNRTWTAEYPYVAGPGQSVTGPLAQNSFCAFSKLQGNFDGCHREHHQDPVERRPNGPLGADRQQRCSAEYLG